MTATQPFTVTIAGGERHDGEKPYTYVANATSRDEAVALVTAKFKEDTENDDIELVEVVEGVPAKDCGYNWNDMRTDVMFRKGRENDVFALFPGLPGTNDPSTCMCYQHIGQHSSADLALCVRQSSPMTVDAAADLYAELTRVGYNLNVVSRSTAAHKAQRFAACKR